MTELTITRRRALVALVVIGVASAAAGAGTFALFSDTEQSTASLNAGTLNLVQSNTPLTFSATDIVPTDSGADYVTLSNGTSTVAGNLSITVTEVTSNESANPDSETDTTAPGELDQQLELRVWIDKNQDGTFNNNDVGLNADGTTTTANKGGYETAASYAGATYDASELNTSSFAGPDDVYVEYRFPDLGSTNNAAQGDDVGVDFSFNLTQR
ncbi:MAG: TasA family protein [Halorientalis sp.]